MVGEIGPINCGVTGTCILDVFCRKITFQLTSSYYYGVPEQYRTSTGETDTACLPTRDVDMILWYVDRSSFCDHFTRVGG